MPVAVHIYPLSRLVHAAAGDWEKHIHEIETNKLFMNRYYSPLRDAAVSYCKLKGKRHEQILSQLRINAGAVSAGANASPVKDNLKAFETFIEDFYPRVGKFEASFLHEESRTGCEFGGLELRGLPHFSVVDSDGIERYVYLHASKWSDDDLKSYLELLSIVVENRFGHSPDHIWCMDLRNGKDVKWRSSTRVRARCEKAARLYARLVAAMSAP